MKNFTMSIFATKEDLYRARAIYWERQFRFLAGKHWVQSEAEPRMNLPETDDIDSYIERLTDAIDNHLLNS